MDEKEKQSVQPFGYCTNILHNLNQEHINTINKHYEKLILSLLVPQPPVRTNFYITAQITTTVNNLDDNTNYIYIKPDQDF